MENRKFEFMFRKVPPIKELRKIASKQSTKGFLNPMCDWLAFYPAKIFLYLPFNPTQITVIWIMIKIFTALLLVKGDYLLTVIALTIFQLASILDGVDGIVFRMRKVHSYNAIYFDYIGHYLCNSLLLICLAIGIYQNTNDPFIIVIGGVAVFSYLLSKAITVNGIWVSNLEMRKEFESIIYEGQFSLKSQQNKVIAWAVDFFLMDNPLNFMFWGVLLGYVSINFWTYTLWIYAGLLTVELLRRMAVQYLRIKRYEKKKREAEQQAKQESG
jgi:phosphatidylglycerophosphate synthase